MYNFSEEAKTKIMANNVTRCYLKVLATDTEPEFIINEENYLKDCTFEELRYVPNYGIIGGAVAKRVTGNFNNIEENFNIKDREFELYFGVDLTNGETEYQKYGTFIVQKPEDNTINDNTEFQALDYMVKANLDYEDRITYPCTLKDLFYDVVDQCGLTTDVESFLNDDFIIENNQFAEGATRRQVLQAIAEVAFNWVRIDENDKVVMDFEQKEESDIVLSIDEYTTFTKSNNYGPINVVTFRNSQVEGENVTIKDEQSIEQYGETEFVISDNPFAYTQVKRSQLIRNAVSLFGLSYTPMTIEGIGYIFLNCKDKVSIEDLKSDTFNTYVFNHTIKYNGISLNTIESIADTKTETKYKFQSDLSSAVKRAEIIVDKANQKITAAIEEIGQYDEKIANLELSVDGLDSKVSSLVDYERTATGINELHLTETIEGDKQVTKFTIKGDSKNFIYLVPSNTLVPSNSLVPLGGRFNIVVDKQSRTEISEDAQIQEIYMDEPLRSYLGIYDELNITEGRITVTRRIGIDEYANLYILDEEVIEDYGEMFIKTFKDDTYIYIKEYYNLEYSADYLVSGELITKKNLGTELKQNAESIQVAWNQISQYVKIEGIDGKATFNIYNENNNMLMKTNQDGQTFYDDYGNELGSIGVVRDEDKDVLAFSMPVNWESIDTSRSMAWGIVGPDKKFLPIFYLAGYYGEESSEYGGELQVEGILSVGQLNVTENLNLESMIGLYWGDEKYIQPILNASDQNREWISYRAPYGHEFAVGNNYFRIRENDMSFVMNDIEYINISENDGDIWLKKPLFVAYNNSTNEGYRGYPLIGINTGYKYFINWDGANLAFYVDNTYVGVLSDKRLKKDFKEIDDNVLKAIDELKIQEFKVINRNGKISFGIIAQDLIDSFKKYKINFEDYEIINSVQYDLNNKTLYYTVEYTQFLILKQLANDKKIEELQKKDKEKDLIIQDLISRIEKLEGGNV